MSRKITLLFLSVMLSVGAGAQQNDVDTLQSALQRLDKQVEALSEKVKAASNLKISGYVQAQWQIGQGEGMPAEYAAGNFPEKGDNRFMIRRGRVKFDFSKGIVRSVLQIDATEKGVKLKDAFVSLGTKNKAFAATVGVFDRPFGYEISYSSSIRETPERSRMYQALMPDERDMGAKITLQGQGKSILNAFRFEGGLFSGNGTAVENNSAKDFIGHLAFNRKYKKVAFGLGTSLYAGKVLNEKEVSFTFDKNTGAYRQNDGAMDRYYRRLYWGVDGQFTANTCVGKTNIRLEYIEGEQPGTLKSSNSPKGSVASEIYNRKFRGYSAYLVQGIVKTNLSLVARFDYYDPNREISASKIGVAAGTSAADVAYSTLGVGALYEISKMFRVMAYYDFVWNEKCSNLTSATSEYADFSKNIKDNVFTLRFQVKF